MRVLLLLRAGAGCSGGARRLVSREENADGGQGLRVIVGGVLIDAAGSVRPGAASAGASAAAAASAATAR